MSKTISGAGDFDHINQRANRAIAIIAVLRAALENDEDGDLGAYPDAVLEVIEMELRDIEKASEQAQRMIEAQAVQQ